MSHMHKPDSHQYNSPTSLLYKDYLSISIHCGIQFLIQVCHYHACVWESIQDYYYIAISLTPWISGVTLPVVGVVVLVLVVVV